MEKKIAVIGGDLRTIYLTEMLAKENTVITYGQELSNIKSDAMKIDNLKNAIELSDIIIGPVPFSKDGESLLVEYGKEQILIKDIINYSKKKILIAGSIKKEACKLADDNDVQIIDLMKEENLTILNTIATAEGALEIAIKKTKRILHGSNVLVLGYGRVARVVAQKFAALSAKVTCAARKPEAFAWIEVDGHESLNINKLGKNLADFDIVINTPPTTILTKDRLAKLKNHCLLIDLASYPGGVDVKAAKELGINFEWALGLPRKDSTYYSGRTHL